MVLCKMYVSCRSEIQDGRYCRILFDMGPYSENNYRNISQDLIEYKLCIDGHKMIFYYFSIKPLNNLNPDLTENVPLIL